MRLNCLSIVELVREGVRLASSKKKKYCWACWRGTNKVSSLQTKLLGWN